MVHRRVFHYQLSVAKSTNYLIEVWNEHAKYTVKQASKVVMIPIYDEVQYNNFAHNPQKFPLQNSIRPICF